jgi:DNA-binding transcriptional MerR regulator
MDSPSVLTAAECATRTGLTPRALRLYEELGLITPRRSPGGWRQYGPRELVRLNVITLLKTAGLTLAQIAGLMGPGTQDPDLRPMLSIQLENWRARRADAERGQRIAETALERLNTGGSLTVDDLCNLIRSLEMTQQQDLGTARPGEPDAVRLDEAVLDRYTGAYQLGEWVVYKVWREGTTLFIEFPRRPRVELRPTGECDFETVDLVEMPVSFPLNPAEPDRLLAIHMKGGDMTAKRVDPEAAARVKARLAERIRDNKPLPGSEVAVRRLVEDFISGQPNYDSMHPALAYIVRQQQPQLHTTAAYLGAIKSIEFQGVGAQGWDVYDVHHERGTARMRIMLRADGMITGALFVVKDGPASLGP